MAYRMCSVCRAWLTDEVHLCPGNGRLWQLQVKALEYYKAGNEQRWRTCLVANRIVGKYEKNATQDLARALRISVSQVENLARAGLTYVQLRKGCPELPTYRKLLTYSHFATMGDCIRKYDIPIHEAIEQIRTAALEGATVGDMRAALEGEYNPDGHIHWQAKLKAVRKSCDWLITELDTPHEVYLAALDFKKATEEWNEG